MLEQQPARLWLGVCGLLWDDSTLRQRQLHALQQQCPMRPGSILRGGRFLPRVHKQRPVGLRRRGLHRLLWNDAHVPLRLLRGVFGGRRLRNRQVLRRRALHLLFQ